MKKILSILAMFLMMTTNNLMAQGMRFPTYDNKTHTAEQQPFADLSQKGYANVAC